MSAERLLFPSEPLRRVRSLARLLIAFSRDSIIDARLTVLMWCNTHDARGGCRQPNYIVIMIQTEIILAFCCMSVPSCDLRLISKINTCSSVFLFFQDFANIIKNWPLVSVDTAEPYRKLAAASWFQRIRFAVASLSPQWHQGRASVYRSSSADLSAETCIPGLQ